MTKTQPTRTSHNDAVQSTQQTLIDHLHELRTRLFWIILALVVAASAGYFIQNQIMDVLMKPLGGQRLVYLTPIGGFNFLFRVSLYFGIGAILPVIIYHLYRFLEPLMAKRRRRSVILYIMSSCLLAIAGACFAYFGSLPAAMHFLTGFNIQNVSAMLTIDSYLTFVITYILGFAALFQIPLILLIFNSIKPIPPRKLMSFQRYVILIAFILAAVISPTPDVTNQTILAVPIILMYQIGVFLVWIQARRRKNLNSASTIQSNTIQQPSTPALEPVNAAPTPIQPAAPPSTLRPTAPQPRPVMDIAAPRRIQPRALRPMQADVVRRAPAARPAVRPQRPLNARPTSIDGIVRHTQPQTS